MRAPAINLPPRADGLPLVGALPHLIADAPAALTRIAYAHPGAVVRIPCGPTEFYLVTHPPHVEHVLQKNWRNYDKSSPMWNPLRRLFGKGLITAEGDEWVKSRRVMQPCFSSRHIASLTDLMVDTIEHSLKPMEQARGAVDMDQEMTIVTQNVVLELLFGVPIQRQEAERLSASLTTALRAINLRMFLYFLPKRLPLPGEAKLRQTILAIDEALFRLYQEHSSRAGTRDKTLLSLLQQAVDPETGESMSERQIRDELVNLWTAGNETTATAMTWLWVLLEQHPEVDARVRKEVAEALGGRKPRHEDLARMPYCKMVIQEAMRLYPPSWLIPRQCVADDEIGGFAVPAGATVLLSQLVTHRNPTIWERPNAFEPERFAPEQAAGRHRFAFIPFGGGPRICIGAGFAMLEAQLILALMVQRFRPRLANPRPIRPVSATALKPSGKMMMRLFPA